MMLIGVGSKLVKYSAMLKLVVHKGKCFKTICIEGNCIAIWLHLVLQIDQDFVLLVLMVSKENNSM
jgi:hypothetical protein